MVREEGKRKPRDAGICPSRMRGHAVADGLSTASSRPGIEHASHIPRGRPLSKMLVDRAEQ